MEESILDKKDRMTYLDMEYPNRTRGVHNVPSIAQSMLAGVNYGFISRSEGCSSNYEHSNEEPTFVGDMGPPANVLSLGSQQFMRNLNAMVGEYKDEDNTGRCFVFFVSWDHFDENSLVRDSCMFLISHVCLYSIDCQTKISSSRIEKANPQFYRNMETRNISRTSRGTLGN
jgi:hypothetical protein